MAAKNPKKSKKPVKFETSQDIVTHIVSKLKELEVDVEVHMMDLSVGKNLPIYYISTLFGSNYPYVGIVPVANSPVLLVAFNRVDDPDRFEQDWEEIIDFDSFVRAYIGQRPKTAEQPIMQRYRTSTHINDDYGTWVNARDRLLDYAVDNKMISTRKEIKRTETVFYVL